LGKVACPWYIIQALVTDQFKKSSLMQAVSAFHELMLLHEDFEHA